MAGEEEEKQFGKYFTDKEVHDLADKVKQISSESLLACIRDDVRNGEVRCSKAEDTLHLCLKLCHREWRHGGPDYVPDACRQRILELSECLKRPGRRPRTNPDII